MTKINYSLISLRSSNLYRIVLLKPVMEGRANQLRIVSGYATPRMLSTHLEDLSDAGLNSLSLFVGMESSKADETALAFQQIISLYPELEVSVKFPNEGSQTHAKAYLWLMDGVPTEAWVGSANYSSLAFGLDQKSDGRDELLTQVDPFLCQAYVNDFFSDSHSDSHPVNHPNSGIAELKTTPSNKSLHEDTDVVLPLVQIRNGKVHNAGAGLNWGQPTIGRKRASPTEAYVPVPIGQGEKLPAKNEIFECFHKGGTRFELIRTQSGGKALCSHPSYKALGDFFRRELRIESDRAITTEDLDNFGSNCVILKKVQDSTYELIFETGNDYFEITSMQVGD